MNKTKLPTSKAKTAYGLLSEVCAIITEEPKRYSQHFYLEHGSAKHFPACGTIGCVAGWVAMLTKRRHDHREPYDIARNALGLVNGSQAYELFRGDAAGPGSQTRTHARAGVKHIRRFQQKYAAQLKAKKV